MAKRSPGANETARRNPTCAMALRIEALGCGNDPSM
jgi:hypothetical protein